MAEEIWWRNFLVIEGRALANGESSQFSPEQWLSQYNQVQEYLVGAQVRIFADFAERIRSRKSKLKKNSVEL